ncbi:hypothetical protein [Parasphingopyxis lamellibrachiae]|uniref:Uncharacterized protein n=1 Tax=Parasphingopyxis lamellibrachiae TaxID=680125 RepID=A0A3D9F618_9SPHN|nr:hypothetical protein [Parasphingopyxis lamellibrachiae]RED11014.1 hypothetical protein DFR46_2959 [Parasphingopyxis lamellibrachiae]
MLNPELDPIQVTSKPNIVSDLERQNELSLKYARRLAWVDQHYWTGRLLFGKPRELNASLGRLRKILAQQNRIPSSLHPMLIVAIDIQAHYAANDGDISGSMKPTEAQHLEAAKHLADKIKLPKRPRDDLLRFHVEAVMAIIIEATGLRVTASRTKNSLYDPRLSEGVSQSVEIAFAQIDPEVSRTTLANIVVDARKKYAGKSMRYDDFFPKERLVNSGQNLELIPKPGFQLVASKWIGIIKSS